MSRFYSIFVTLLLFYSISLNATHNRAGEITYKHIGNLTYEIKIITYTYTPSPADRPELTVKWGDGKEETVKRINKINYDNDISYNEYRATHTYPGAAEYKISFEDPNRNGGVINIPNSVNVPFYVETILVINPFMGANNSPELLNPPIDNACVGRKFVHNPGVFDKDGDSISYKIIECRGESGNFIAGYNYPIGSKSFYIDAYTGDLVWDSPTIQGEFNIAIEVEKWRSGIKIGSIVRDMQILVQACKNNPPEIVCEDEICVIAGTIINLPIKAFDKDSDMVSLYGTGGPMYLNSNYADFVNISGIGEVESLFKWETNCSHVQKHYYNVIFKAIDNSYPVNLSDIKTLKIKVVGPAAKFNDIYALGNTIHVSWDSYICQNAIGLKLYRREGYADIDIDTCHPGIPEGMGFQLINDIKSIEEGSFKDNPSGGLKQGINYCYALIAYFADGAESIISDLICVSLKRDIPIITNVSVEHTDKEKGHIQVMWSKAKELDTSVFKPPYTYKLYRSQALLDNYQLIETFLDINDTICDDTIGLNTESNTYLYKIEFYSQDLLLGTTSKASSVYLNSSPTDNMVKLSYSFDVPWSNYHYTIYRLNDNNTWDSLSTTNSQYYEDKDLENGKKYCYYVESIGNYSIDNIMTPLYNKSQIRCDVPIDDIPPCAPIVSVSADCENYVNSLIWNNPNNSCADDVVKYNIYYSLYSKGPYNLVGHLLSGTDTIFLHVNSQTISGCYYVTALDSFGNESYDYKIQCVNILSCPEYLYKLPNVFTPNNDNKNDFFTPFKPYGGVESIDFLVFNRWGNVVFKTTDLDINWDGKHYKTKLDCSDGVYYYILDIYEYDIEDLKKRQLKGFIHILRD